MRIAAVDIGTNTVRLLVSDVGHEILVIARGREITRLGEGVDASKSLQTEAMARTVQAVSELVSKAKANDAEHIRIAGTSALRDASNSDEFGSSIEAECGVRLEILSGSDEGRLAYMGAISGLPSSAADGNYVVLDVGGGSTELSTKRGSVSMDVGSVRLTERILKDTPPSGAQVDRAVETVGAALDKAAALGLVGREKLIGVAGTITTIAALIQGLETYDREKVHQVRLKRTDVFKMTRKLLASTPDEIMAIGPVEPRRADVIGAGALILRQVMKRFLFEEVIVSETDILDGLVLDLAQRVA